MSDHLRERYLAKFNAIPHAKGTKEYSLEFERLTHEYADALQAQKKN